MALPDGLTDELIAASIEKTLEGLDAHKQELHGLLLVEVKEVVMMQATPRVKAQRLDAVVARISDILSPIVACGRGCSHCCKMACAISSQDAKKIEAFTGRKAVRIRMTEPSFDTQATMVAKWEGVACPFLKNDECSIYEVRPLSCRTHFNLSAYPAICDIITNPGNDVPNLDMRPVWAADVQIHWETEAYADIRSFFPLPDDDDDIQSL